MWIAGPFPNGKTRGGGGWVCGHGPTNCACYNTRIAIGSAMLFLANFPDNNLYRESAPGAQLWIAGLCPNGRGGGGGHGPTNCVVITTMSPSDRRCCSCRSFPDNNLYRGKCARRRIVDRWPGSPLQGVGEGGGGLAWGWAMGGRASVVWTSLVVTVVGVVSLSSTWRFVAASSVRGSEVAHQDLPTLAPPPLTLPMPPPPPFPASHTRQIAAANCEPR